MQPFPFPVIVAGLSSVALGLPFGRYVILTRTQRRTMREIRTAASARGWRYRLRHWQGNPTAFRIDGRTRSGLTWVLTSGNTRSYDRDWTVGLGLRFPTLGGEVDLAVLPRHSESHSSAPLGSAIPLGAAVASAVGFFREARPVPSSFPPFDAAYQVLALPRQICQPPVDRALAGRILSWPSDAIAPHSVLAWRDPFGFHIHARLPAAPDLATVSYFVALAEDFCARIPAPMISPVPSGFADRLAAHFLRS